MNDPKNHMLNQLFTWAYSEKIEFNKRIDPAEHADFLLLARWFAAYVLEGRVVSRAECAALAGQPVTADGSPDLWNIRYEALARAWHTIWRVCPDQPRWSEHTVHLAQRYEAFLLTGAVISAAASSRGASDVPAQG